MMKMLRNFKF